MRNGNGLGSVYKLSGNRRRPYIARVTTGWNDEGKQLYKTIGYFKTKKEGVIALNTYLSSGNINDHILFSEVYDKWSSKKYESLSDKMLATYKRAYKYCEPLHSKKFVDLKVSVMQEFLDSLELGTPTLQKIKTLLSQLSDWCVMNEIIQSNKTNYLVLPEHKQEEKIIFTQEQINLLWEHEHDPWIDSIIFMIYTGLRVGEMLNITKEDIKDNVIHITEAKTSAGVRYVPIPDKLSAIVNKRLSNGLKYIFSNTGRKLSYYTYRDYFNKIMSDLNIPGVTIHSCRHTTASLFDRLGVNPVVSIKILGHTDYKTTVDNYVHKDMEDMRSAINMI